MSLKLSDAPPERDWPMQTKLRPLSPAHGLGLFALCLALVTLACATFRAPDDPAPTRPPTQTATGEAPHTSAPTLALTATPTPTATPTITATSTRAATLLPTRPVLTGTDQAALSATPPSSAQ